MIAKQCANFVFLVLFLNPSLIVGYNRNNNNNRVECGIAKQDAESDKLYQGQWPFTAAIYHLLNNQVTFLCGGTIVSRIFIITGKYLM